MFNISKNDWKIFQSKVGSWQERYMEQLCKEYIEILQAEKRPSERFWELERRIKTDKRCRGVFIRLEKENAIDDIVAFLRDNIITYVDLAEFSEELQSEIRTVIVERNNYRY